MKCEKGGFMTYPRLHKIYENMKNRCYNYNDINFQNYGGKEIKLCDERLLSRKLSLGYYENSTK